MQTPEEVANIVFRDIMGYDFSKRADSLERAVYYSALAAVAKDRELSREDELKKKSLRKMFPDWASPEAVIERLRKEYGREITESDIYRNSSGDVVITQDFEHFIIFPDEQRPGLYSVARLRIFDKFTSYSDANDGLAPFQESFLDKSG